MTATVDDVAAADLRDEIAELVRAITDWDEQEAKDRSHVDASLCGTLCG